MPMLDDWMTFVCDGCREVYAGTPEFTEREMTFCCETCWDATKYAKPDVVPCELFVSQTECAVRKYICELDRLPFCGCRYDAEGDVTRYTVLYCPWRRLAAGSEFAELSSDMSPLQWQQETEEHTTTARG